MNLRDTYAELIEVLDGVDGVSVVTEGFGWTPPCVVLGFGSWQLRGSHYFPVLNIDVVLDGFVVENYALNLIEQQGKVIKALMGQSFLANVTPGGAMTREFKHREYIVARTTALLLYD